MTSLDSIQIFQFNCDINVHKIHLQLQGILLSIFIVFIMTIRTKCDTWILYLISRKFHLL